MRFLEIVTAALILAAAPVSAAPRPLPPAAALSYVDLVDLALGAPIVAGATIRRATRLKGADAAAIPSGTARFYVEADVAALIRGTGGLASAVDYLADVPLPPGGPAPKLKKLRVLLLAGPVAGRPGSLRLVSPAAQLDWTPATEARLRGIVAALLATDAPPRITGVANAFHVPGSLPGESETQIFLATGDGRPVSLQILRHPGERPRWAVALGEMVDEAAATPAPETLLWYRLACGLPPALPDMALGSLDPAQAAAAQADYRVVLDGLGPCTRSPGRPLGPG